MSPTIFALLDVLSRWVHQLRSLDPLSTLDVTHVSKDGSPCWQSCLCSKKGGSLEQGRLGMGVPGNWGTWERG